jgi:116 kDa U5 small nuclear ribonucleoprotein component
MGHCRECNASGPVVVYVAKLFPKPDCSAFDAYGRVFSGSLQTGDRVRVLGEAYTPDDEEDSSVAEVSKLWVYMGRYRIPVSRAPAGVYILCATA